MAGLKVLGNRPIFAFGANMVRVVDDYAATYLQGVPEKMVHSDF